MRKDVKLGFAIGGVLLAVLIVYVLVVPGSDKSPPPQTKGGTLEKVMGDGGNGIASGATAKAPAAPTATTGNPTGGIPVANGAKQDPFARGAKVPTATDAVAQTPKPDARWDFLDGQLPLNAATSSGDPAATSGGVKPATLVAVPSGAAIPPSISDLLTPTTQRSPSAGSAVAIGTRTHVVREGENLSTISAAAYGSANYYPHILRANPGLDPKKLKPGQEIKLPDVGDVKREGMAVPASTGGTVSINSNSEYKVMPDDNLYKISIKLYGKSDRQTKIYELNKSVIGADPAKLKVGTVLKLPEAPTVATAR